MIYDDDGGDGDDDDDVSFRPIPFSHHRTISVMGQWNFDDARCHNDYLHARKLFDLNDLFDRLVHF